MAKKASSRKTLTGRGKRTRLGASSKPARKSTGKTAAKGLAKSKAPAAERSAKVSLSKAELKEFRQMLLAKRRELVGDMSGIEAEALGADRQESKGDISDHPADAGTDNFEQEFSLGLLESERALLGEIDEALRRMEEGTYGVCQGTGRPISTTRLKARPWSKYGIDYARMIEKGLVRPGDRLGAADSDEEIDDDADEEVEDQDGSGDRDDFEEQDELREHDDVAEG